MKSTLILKVSLGLVYLSFNNFEKEEIALLWNHFIAFSNLAVYIHERFTNKNILLTALTLSWIGDIILMFADKGELYFIAGLLAFYFHIFLYIIPFSKTN
jgi:uncharacterized membrane protein YhhN